MSDDNKTHYRKAFDSPYLSSADIVGPTALTIARVTLEKDRTKKTPDMFNTAHFVERELRPGEKLKPMILNATNSKFIAALTGSKWIDDWNGIAVTVYVDPQVRFGRETVEGLRLAAPDSAIAKRGKKERVKSPISPERFAAALAAIAAGSTSADVVRRNFDLSEEQDAQLTVKIQELVNG